MTREIDPSRLAALNDSYEGREYSDAYDPIKHAPRPIPDLQTFTDRLAGSGSLSTFAASRTAMISNKEQVKLYFKDRADDRKPPRARKLTNQMISDIKVALNENTPAKALAEKYSISLTTISFISTGHVYPNIEPLTYKQKRKIQMQESLKAFQQEHLSKILNK